MVKIVHTILAYEFLAACAALDQRPESPGTAVRQIHEHIRNKIPRLETDRSPGPDVERLLEMLKNGFIQKGSVDV